MLGSAVGVGRKVKVITDHEALLWLRNLKDSSGRLARWTRELQMYSLEIVHRPGKEHTNADALSRLVECNAILSQKKEPSDDKALKGLLEEGKLPEGTSKHEAKRVEKAAESMRMVNGTIEWLNKQQGKWLVVSPVEARKRLIEEAHSLGYFHGKNTSKRLLEKFVWPGMRKQIRSHIDQCETCLKNEAGETVETDARSDQIPRILEKIGIDLTRGFTETKRKNKGLLVIVDHFSKFPYAVPIADKTAETIPRESRVYIGMFGAPKVMLSDNVNEFINQKVEELLRKFGVKHRLTATYKPRTNGQTETLNAGLRQVVRKIAEKNPLDWDEMLPAVLMALRSKVHEAHAKTPFEMVFGKKMRIPTEEKIGRSKEIQGLKKLRSSVRPKMEKYQKTIRETQDKRAERRINRLAAGNILFLKQDELLSKLDCRYRGPYKTQGLTRKGNCKIVVEILAKTPVLYYP
jgi:hypothetical protein